MDNQYQKFEKAITINNCYTHKQQIFHLSTILILPKTDDSDMQ